MNYYLGGYYLIRLRPMDFGPLVGKTVHTCSSCINNSLLESWAYSWTSDNNLQIDTIKKDYSVNDNTVSKIRQWVDRKFEDKRIGWNSVFADLETAKEYRQIFFSHLTDVKIMAVYFSESETNDFVGEFKPEGENSGTIGLYENLSNRIIESESTKEELLGFDLIGVELDGSFHTFYCNSISEDLLNTFGLNANEYGLFNDRIDWKPVVVYMNDEVNGLEPVPWFVAKVKLVRE
ncbi:hypothetical protein [Solitalea lacus]|uniref:hypothetical protein n=1 Tax=Solitalea lacus TaxID=2911172 RepID=UPI001ED9CD9F|nr:hypothetical protein [Solitalea lacus]UKJ09121.1 hypothetical protein L2B55_08135 [Solitalea lacus]